MTLFSFRLPIADRRSFDFWNNWVLSSEHWTLRIDWLFRLSANDSRTKLPLQLWSHRIESQTDKVQSDLIWSHFAVAKFIKFIKIHKNSIKMTIKWDKCMQMAVSYGLVGWVWISCTQSGLNNNNNILINYDKLFWLHSTNIKTKTNAGFNRYFFFFVSAHEHSFGLNALQFMSPHRIDIA